MARRTAKAGDGAISATDPSLPEAPAQAGSPRAATSAPRKRVAKSRVSEAGASSVEAAVAPGATGSDAHAASLRRAARRARMAAALSEPAQASGTARTSDPSARSDRTQTSQKPEGPEPRPAAQGRPTAPAVSPSAAPAAPAGKLDASAPPQPPPTLAELIMSSDGGDYETLSRNLGEAMTRANAVFTSAMQGGGNSSSFRVDPFDAQNAMNQAWSHLATQPETLRDAHTELWRRYAAIWQDHATRWMLGSAAEAQPVATRDKRFRDPEWGQNPYFSLLRDTYLATADWITGLVGHAEGLDEATQRKASFFIKQAVDAASPSNFLLTNPTALKATLQSKGENLVHGLENLADDLKRGHGALAIRQTDLEAFRVGENIATTPGKVIYRNELIELLQYSPTTERVHETPLLIFPPWINKFYILDLQEKNSFIRWLVAQGHTVFVASWVNPDVALAEKTFEDYMRDGVFAATEAALTATGAEHVNAVGYCIGGTLLATSLAYMAQIGDRRIKSATYFAAQMDFKLAGELLVFTDDAAIKYVEELIDASGGFLDSQAMADTFNALRSNDLVWNYVVENYYLGKRPAPFDLLYWNADQTRMPRALHMFYLRRFYHDNALSEGDLTLLGRKLSLRDVTIPIYMQSSKEDHISPAGSVYRSAKLFGGPVRFMMAGSGHIAGVINPPQAHKYQHWTNDALPDELEGWISGAAEHPGSWWSDWDAWLAAHSSAETVPARIPGEGPLKALGDAPGEYVRVKSQG